MPNDTGGRAPMIGHASTLYLLLPSPHHRRAGRKFFPVGRLPDNVKFEGYEALGQFNRISSAACPGLTIGWRHRDRLFNSAA